LLFISSKDRFSCVFKTKGLQDLGLNQGAGVFTIASLSNLKEPMLIENFRENDQAGFFSNVGAKGLPCQIVFPLIVDKTLLGAVQIFTLQEVANQYRREKEVFDTVSAYAAMCLGKALHFKELGEKARLEGELEAARRIQRRFISSHIASIPRISLKGAYYPANEVSGDYLDYFKTPSGCWVVVIADVCGKGVPAALVMAMLRCTFRGEAKRTDASNARELVLSVNDHFMSGTYGAQIVSFVTVLCLVINADGTSMTYSRAGHPPLLHFRSDDSVVEPVPCNGIALGILDSLEAFSAQIEQVTVPLVKGERFFIYTDGLIEAFDSKRDSYGTERLLANLSTISLSDPGEMIEKVMINIKNFTKGAPNHDDLTMLAMTVSG
jgi:phosphoserine phosphatase RsbU/P